VTGLSEAQMAIEGCCGGRCTQAELMMFNNDTLPSVAGSFDCERLNDSSAPSPGTKLSVERMRWCRC
jgi:hypothetical protein